MYVVIEVCTPRVLHHISIEFELLRVYHCSNMKELLLVKLSKD